MKQYLFFIAFIFLVHSGFCQDNGPREIKPQDIQKIKADIAALIPALKQSFVKSEMTADQIEFSIDTFRIEQMESRMMEIDYSTAGMRNAVNEKTNAYDKLLNKYYNKLLKLMLPEDKKTLIAAQKAWIAYRDAESNLIGAMMKDVYSGGGTMQSLIATDSYSQMVIQRTIEIFNYYDGIVKN